MYKSVIWDFDGTIFDTIDAWEKVPNKFLNSLGYEYNGEYNDIFSYMGINNVAYFCKEKYKFDMSTDEIVAKYIDIVSDFYENEAKPINNVLNLLNKMKNLGIKMCLATGSPRFLVLMPLKKYNIIDYFSNIFTATEIKQGKDDEVMYKTSVESLGETPQNIVLIEDSYKAIQFAKKIGLNVIGIYESHESEISGMKNICDLYIENYSEENQNKILDFICDNKL